MSDNLANRGQPDRSKINVHESWEVAYWTRELGVSEEKLIAAVQAAGTSVKSVKEHLGLH